MDECDCDRAFADCRCDSLDVAAANVPDREDTWKARLEKMRLSLERPLRGIEIFRRNIESGFDEAVVVERHAVVEPFGRRHRSRHYEHVADVFNRVGSVGFVAATDILQMFPALERD